MKRWSAFVACFIALALFVPVSAAQARAPRQSTFEVHFTFEPGPCDGFTLNERVHLTVHTQRFFGQDGIRRETSHVTWEGVITNKATGEFIAMDPGRWKDTFIGNEVTTTGRVFAIKIKALDIFIRGIGRIVYNVKTGETYFQSGPDNHHQNYNDLCDALA